MLKRPPNKACITALGPGLDENCLCSTVSQDPRQLNVELSGMHKELALRRLATGSHFVVEIRNRNFMTSGRAEAE